MEYLISNVSTRASTSQSDLVVIDTSPQIWTEIIMDMSEYVSFQNIDMSLTATNEEHDNYELNFLHEPISVSALLDETNIPDLWSLITPVSLGDESRNSNLFSPLGHWASDSTNQYD
jgi:hypothetical protein